MEFLNVTRSHGALVFLFLSGPRPVGPGPGLPSPHSKTGHCSRPRQPMAPIGPNEARLLVQANVVRSITEGDPAFGRVVVVLRNRSINITQYTMPPDKHVSVYDQHSPVGSSRVVAGAADIDEHVRRASSVSSMPSKDPWQAVQRDLASAVRVVASAKAHPANLIHRRKDMEAVIRWASAELRPLDARLRRLAPPHVRRLPTVISVAMSAALVVASGWPDITLPARLLFGSPTTGDLPPSRVMRTKLRKATVDPYSFDVAEWAASLHASIEQRGRRASRKARAADLAVLQKSVAEAVPVAVNGRVGSWSSGPFSLSDVQEMFPGGFWPSRRFGVEQKGDVRPCDNNRESHLNDSVDATEAISPDTADMPSVIADLFFRLLGSATDLRGGCDDWKKAYRQIPTSDPSRSVVALWDPVQKQVVYFVVWGHCFGQLSAVNSFNAVSKFLAGMSRMFFAHCGGNYFDDHFTVEPSYMGGSGQSGLACLAAALGFLFDPNKHTDMMPSFVYLGVQHDLSRASAGVVRLRILPARRRDLVKFCDDVLKQGYLPPGRAASLRGKLYFAASTAYGKVGRAALQPIIQRQERPGTAYNLNPSMLQALKFFITLLRNMPDREMVLGEATTRPLIVWSDASWEHGVGRLGFVVYVPESGEFLHSSSDIPQHILDMFVRNKQKIGQCEILAANVPYYSLPDLFRGRQVIHWIDNTSAISCLIHGYSGRPDSALLVNAFNMFNAGLRCRIHYEYVESKANVADLPSRGSFLYLTDVLGSRWVDTECLEAGTWEGPLRMFLELSGASRPRPLPRKRKR